MVTVYGPLTADFSANITEVAEGQVIQFSNLCSGGKAPLIYEWDLNNDGIVGSTEPNPKFTYTAEGNYTVFFKVTDSALNTDSETKEAYISVYDTGPTADFSATPSSGSEPLTVTFTDNSTSYDGIVSWQWSFVMTVATATIRTPPISILRMAPTL